MPKKIVIERYSGDNIEIIGERSWGSLFPEPEEIAKKQRLGEEFISIKGLNKEIVTIRINEIINVIESDIEEEKKEDAE